MPVSGNHKKLSKSVEIRRNLRTGAISAPARFSLSVACRTGLLLLLLVLPFLFVAAAVAAVLVCCCCILGMAEPRS